MKKYNVYVILKDKFHSVVIECDGVVMEEKAYRFYRTDVKGNGVSFAWYPIEYTIIEEQKQELKLPKGSGGIR